MLTPLQKLAEETLGVTWYEHGRVTRGYTTPGRQVRCDGPCFRDMTDSDEQGGVEFRDPPAVIECDGEKLLLITDVCFCLRCAGPELARGRKPKSICPEGMTFADWVRDVIRKQPKEN